VLAIFSVPEAERDKRHQLRSRLAWLGFGTVAAGVWVAPGHLVDETRDLLQRQCLADYVDLFRADHAAFGDVAEKVAQWWDLDRLRALYDEFLLRYHPVLSRHRRRRTTDPRTAFADYVPALTDWRRLPYLDPGLPPELLPARWPGLRAAETFFALRELLTEPAHAFVDAAR
jgi:phenylacetic acid degradation operon negative regulatory protein